MIKQNKYKNIKEDMEIMKWFLKKYGIVYKILFQLMIFNY